MALVDLPSELQLAISRRLGVIDRLALGSTCRSAAPLVVHVALLKFKLSKRTSGELEQCSAFIRGDHSAERCVSLDKVKFGKAAVCEADADDRTKGHLPPLYDATGTDGLKGRIIASGTERHDVGGECFAWPWPAFTNWGTEVLTGARDAPWLPVGLAPDKHVSLGFSDAMLAMAVLGQPPRPAPMRSVSFRSSLIVLDLSRAHHVASVGACGLASLREAALPPAVRVASFEGCDQLRSLRLCSAPGTCAALLSLRLGGCRRLDGGSLLGTANGATSLRPGGPTPGGPTPRAPEPCLSWCSLLAELDLSWCAAVDPAALCAILPAATRLRSLSLRGLAAGGALEALLASAAPPEALAAADLAFCTGLVSASVLGFARAYEALSRCNLRGAAAVDAAVYNEVGQLMQARAAAEQSDLRPDLVENRRRPQHLAPRPPAPFFYLKRSARTA